MNMSIPIDRNGVTIKKDRNNYNLYLEGLFPNAIVASGGLNEAMAQRLNSDYLSKFITIEEAQRLWGLYQVDKGITLEFADLI